jgi:hypothetical protein
VVVPGSYNELAKYINAGTVQPDSFYTRYVDHETHATLGFSTPDGAISCGLNNFSTGTGANTPTAWVTCWVGVNSWPPITLACGVGNLDPDWVISDSAVVHQGACVSDQFIEDASDGYQMPRFPMPGQVLPYGTTIVRAPEACRSESAFLACMTNKAGFVISKSLYQTYRNPAAIP